jgi:hypothetical protein
MCASYKIYRVLQTVVKQMLCQYRIVGFLICSANTIGFLSMQSMGIYLYIYLQVCTYEILTQAIAFIVQLSVSTGRACRQPRLFILANPAEVGVPAHLHYSSLIILHPGGGRGGGVHRP